MIARRFRGTATARQGGSVNLTIRMTPKPRVIPCPPSGSGDCVVAVTGLQWCLYNDALYTLTSDEATPPTYTMAVTTEEPTCSSENIAISLSGGYVPTDQDGYYVFSLIGEVCDGVVEWSYQFAEDATPLWSELLQPYVAGGVLIVPVSAASTYAVGVATISATLDGVVYGPITITLASGY